MAKTEYIEDGLYQVEIDTNMGTVSLGGENYINDNRDHAYIFQVAYLLGREHKKIADNKSIGLIKELNSETIMKEIAENISKGVPYIDAVIVYADKYGLEVEVIGEIIRRSPVLKAKIYREAEELNMVEKLTRLPV